jgi:CelD/BcsL family acetyltransferase involved in cellulose biosynthesis
MACEVIGARDGFARRRAEWDELNRALGNNVLLDSRFVEPLIQLFGGPAQHLLVYDDGHHKAMALVERTRPGFWRTFQPSQAPLGLILLHPDTALAQTLAMIRYLPGYAVALGIHQQDPDITPFTDIVAHRECERFDYIDTARITVSGTFDDYWATVHKNLRQNVDRRQRRLAREGISIELVETRDAADVAACVAEYSALEASGWKGDKGTAVIAGNFQAQFYRTALEALCREREAVIYRLRMGDKTIASDLCVERNGILVILKTAYDESLSNHSPGLIIHREIIRRVFLEGRVKRIEFYGRALDWHHKLTSEVRTMFHVNVYRHGIVRSLRSSLKRIRSARAS